MDDIADLDRTAPAAPNGPTGDGPRRARLGRDVAADQRAFVVQLTADPTADAFCGRVQQLSTLDGGNFSSPDGLIAILRRVLERRPTRDGTGDE
jgi:hypothetical protein